MKTPAPPRKADTDRPPPESQDAPPPRKPRWLALLAFLAAAIIVTLLAGIMMPVQYPVDPQGPTASCVLELRQIWQALRSYASKNDGQLAESLDTLLRSEDLPPALFRDQHRDERPEPPPIGSSADNLSVDNSYSYVYAADDLTAALAELPPNTVLVYEPLWNHGDRGSHMLLADGRVKFVPAALAKRVIVEVESGHNPPRREVVGPWPPP